MNADDRTSSGVRIPPPLVYLAGLGTGFVLQWWLPLALVAAPGKAAPVRYAGYALIVLGIALAGAAIGMFRQAGTSPNPTRPTTALVATGPYRFTRNPMYLGLALVHAGIALAADALWPLVALAPVLAVIRYRVIAREEAYMAKKFGAAYADYCGRVRRWL